MTPCRGARYRLHEAAAHDLDAVATYFQQDSPQVAIRFLEAAQETFERLTQTPELGGLFESSHLHLSGIRIWRVKGF